MTESVDMYDALRRSDAGRSIMERIEEEARLRDGVAQQAQWKCEDGWIVIYTTSRVQGGPSDGKFVTQLMRPHGKGARTGQATLFKESYRRTFSTRKAAKARAEALYRQHSPKYDKDNPL